MTPEQLALIQGWHAAKQELERWEAYERELRSRVVHSMFGDYGDGSKTADIGNGYELRNTNTTRHDIANTPEMRQLVAQFVAYSETAEIGKALIADKPRLSLRAYKRLPQWGRKLLDVHVTSTPQLPQLTIIPPRG